MEIQVERINIEFSTIKEYTIKNLKGVTIKLLNLGATIKEIHTSDRNGVFENIALTYKDYKDYFENSAYLGATIGPIAGRVAGALLNIGSSTYKLEANDDINSLHSGKNGLSRKLWESSIQKRDDAIDVIFSIKKLCGEGGHPGNIDIKVIYSLNEKNEFKIRYEAISDKKTVLNLTNHLYLNLSGENKRKITSHFLKIPSDYFYKNSENHIITSRKQSVKGSEYDFSQLSLIKDNIKYNEYYPFSDNSNLVEIYEKISGRKVSINTSHKGVVLYTSGYPDYKILSSGKKYENLDGLALEFQNKPIGENNLFMLDSILEAREMYSRESIYKFEIES